MPQHSASRRRRRPVVSSPVAHDRHPLARRLRGSRVRHPSSAGGIRGLGGRRKDVFSGVFFMLTLAAYLSYVRHPFLYCSLLRCYWCSLWG